jgi:membrane-associated phospholipid phosphatase
MSSSLSTNATRAWRADLVRRIVTLWHIKSLGTMCWIAAFFTAYFWVLRNPAVELTTVPLTPLDGVIDFQPGALLLYVSLWVYVSLAPALLKNFRELFSYGLATLAMSLVGLAIFYWWPTAVPHFEIDLVQHPTLSVLKGMDMSANACPSLHVAFAVFTAMWLDHVLREMKSVRGLLVFNWLWCAGIIYSTIATRQHVVLDVIAGTALGIVVAIAHMRALQAFEARWAVSSTSSSPFGIR